MQREINQQRVKRTKLGPRSTKLFVCSVLMYLLVNVLCRESELNLGIELNISLKIITHILMKIIIHI